MLHCRGAQKAQAGELDVCLTQQLRADRVTIALVNHYELRALLWDVQMPSYKITRGTAAAW
eukprot:1441669-Pyramimonas_sp.AAC.2